MSTNNGQFDDEFNIEHQFKIYLQTHGYLRKQIKPEKYRLMKEAFNAGLGNMLVLMQNNLPNLRDPDKIEAKINQLVRSTLKFYEKDTRPGLKDFYKMTLRLTDEPKKGL